MDNYTKGKIVEIEEANDEMPDFIKKDILHMKLNKNSKVRNSISYALKKFQEENIKEITWSGTDEAISKVISCVEIIKKRIRNLYQLTNIRYIKIEEYWEPKIDSLDRIKVTRNIPAISILLSKIPLDNNLDGYQFISTNNSNSRGIQLNES